VNVIIGDELLRLCQYRNQSMMSKLYWLMRLFATKAEKSICCFTLTSYCRKK